ncbi:hypothetical protein Tsubulata_007939 [Turnera subulata]|uniref:C3H1-type domain-containing protein n=1 Tax=Turnera subulata TaxID=218843 RepID=A0A9Q0G4C4_9ROSI|nr:hypothetical protein Tsubulata_007939 [Turnera subulata]
MTRAEFDKECKICTRPFTVFRWRPGRDARFKKTEVCQTCSKLKNVCQVCLLDLEYGLPVQVRDTALSINSNDAIPKSDVNREYFAKEHDRRVRANDTILKLQRTTPYYKRNRAHVCSFYVRGECTRGAECPYRHDMPVTGELSQQNIKDRYYGVNDPVALKLLNKAGDMPSLEPPEDESIKTLYIGGLDARISEQDLRDPFYAHGEIESIKMVLQRAIAFVTYTTREGSEKAAEELSNKLFIKSHRLKLMWGRLQAPKPDLEVSDEARQQAMMAHGGMLPLQLYHNNRTNYIHLVLRSSILQCTTSIFLHHLSRKGPSTRQWILYEWVLLFPLWTGLPLDPGITNLELRSSKVNIIIIKVCHHLPICNTNRHIHHMGMHLLHLLISSILHNIMLHCPRRKFLNPASSTNNLGHHQGLHLQVPFPPGAPPTGSAAASASSKQ